MSPLSSFDQFVQGLSGDVGIVGNDPQTSQFLISSIQETLRLEGLEEGRTEPSQSNHSTREETGKPVDIPLTKPDTVDDKDEQLQECVKENEVEEARPAVNSDDVDTETKEEKKETTPPRAMRKSTRLQRKRFFEGAQSPNHCQSKARKRSKSEENAGDSEKSTVAQYQDSANAKPSSEKSAKDEESLGKKKETAGF